MTRLARGSCHHRVVHGYSSSKTHLRLVARVALGRTCRYRYVGGRFGHRTGAAIVAGVAGTRTHRIGC